MTITQSNSTIFTTRIFGNSTNETSDSLSSKNLQTIEEYLSSSEISNLGTKLPTLPSNQKIAKD